MSNLRTTLRSTGVAVRAVLVMTLLLGVVYPLVVTGIGQVAFPWQSNGSVITENGKAVGSSLLGQSFSDEKGNPLPQYFQPRPSAGGYDPTASGGSNLGPSNPELVKQIEQRRAEVAAFNGVAPSQVPADALTASSSGLDSQISPAYALLQVRRVAEARDMREDDVRAIVESHIQGPDLGFLGEERVNVLELNLALDAASGASR
ncbi:potassium-transporting ATPase subunit KdpC [Microbacterium sp. NPDC057659]|uniref:potassium-transporting ATPase subunit KdpC n=1 Tax=Microbacterium sp. NPDC057659 TaxID=3346198 RepID=UPI003670ACCE